MSPRRSTQFPFRPGPFKFRPPLDVPLVHTFAALSGPLFLRSKGIARIEFADGVVDKLRPLTGQRAVLTPNHPGYEPVVLYLLLRRIGQRAHYLAAKEVFILSWLQGFIAQRIGAYSIVRGTNDREAIRTTRDIIAAGRRWLVAFPEGQDHYHGDILLPFQNGVVQMVCWALDKLHEGGALPPVYMVPVAVRYHYLRDMLPQIDASLLRIERHLQLAPDASLSRHKRMLRAGETIAASHETVLGLKPGADATLAARLDAVREALLRKVAEMVPTKLPPADQPLRDRLRALFNAVEQLGGGKETSAYSRELREQEQRRAAELYRELDRVLGFVAATGTYVAERPSQERMLDVLGRMERELFHRERSWGPRRALVLVGEPIDVAARYGEYVADKRGFVQGVTLELEKAVQRMLDESAELQRPFSLDS